MFIGTFLKFKKKKFKKILQMPTTAYGICK